MTNLSPLSGSLSPLGVSRRRGGVVSEYCLGFDGVDDYVAVGVLPAIDASDFTLSCWCKSTVTTGGQGLITNDADGNGIISLRIELGAAYFQCRGVDGTGLASLIGPSVANGSWHLLVGTRSGATIKLYVDGREVASGTTTTGDLQATSWNIGRRNFAGNSHSLTGSVDDPRIYNRALTADEVSSIYCNSSSPPTSGLVFYPPLDEGTGTTATDTIGGLVCTLTNGPTWQPQTPPRLISGRDTEDWSVQFAGGTQHIATTVDSDLNGLATATLSFWFKRTAVNNAIEIGKGAANRTLCVEVWGDGKVYLEPAEGATKWGSFVCNDTAWHLLTMVYDGTAVGNAGRLKGYLDGAEQALTFVGTIPATTQTFSDQFNIGKGGGTHSTGLIKKVRLYYSALSAASIRLLAKGKEPSDTMAHHWPLNEGTGTTAVDSVAGANGTLTNGPTWSDDVCQWFRVAIESSQALSTSSLKYVDCGDGASLAIASYITVSLWANRTSGRPVLTHGTLSGTNGGFGVDFGGFTAGQFEWFVGGAGGYASRGIAAPTGWSHFCGTYNKDLSGSTKNPIYLNGALQSGTTLFGDPDVVAAITYSPSKSLQIGSHLHTAAYFNGLIDEVCIHNRALSAAAIADQAAGYRVSAGLLSLWKLDGNSLDAQGANNGTEQGGVGYSTSVPGTL